MNRESRVWETPDEEHLASLMNRAAELVVPGDNYFLNLEAYGITPQENIYTDLENRFDVRLDTAKGSDLHLTQNRHTDELEVEHFSAALPYSYGRIYLDRAFDDVYLPSVKLNGTLVHAQAQTTSPKWQNGLSERLLEGHGIDRQPPLDADHHRIWLGETILSKCQSWMLWERLALSRGMGETASKLSILHGQDVPKYTPMSREIVSIFNETTDYDGDQMVTYNEVLSLVSNLQRQHLVRRTIEVTGTADGEQQRVNRAYRKANNGDIALFTDILEEALEKS